MTTDTTTQPVTPDGGTPSDTDKTEFKFETWFESQPEDVRNGLQAHEKSLKSALDAERDSRSTFEREAKSLREKAAEAERWMQQHTELKSKFDALSADAATKNQQHSILGVKLALFSLLDASEKKFQPGAFEKLDKLIEVDGTEDEKVLKAKAEALLTESAFLFAPRQVTTVTTPDGETNGVGDAERSAAEKKAKDAELKKRYKIK